MYTRRRHGLTRLLATALTLACAALAPSAHAAWPDKPVKVIVPCPAGCSLDGIVRTLAEPLRARWGQPLVVENRAGAGGTLGMDAVAKAPADGHTLGIGFNGPIAFAPFLYKRLPYQPERDLLPVVLTTSQPNVLAVRADHPARSLPEFLAWARKEGSRLSYASVGNGSSSHLAAELMLSQIGVDAVHVPYSGSPPAVTSLAAGETQMLITVEPPLMPLIQGGRVRLLATTGAKRMESLPQLPTLAESGLPGFEALAWNGLFVPAGTPAAVVERVNADVNAVLQQPAVREALAKQGLVVGGGTPAAFRGFIQDESRKWGAVIRKVGITID
ncbi:Bug family tripartite tricarboxylate transporter substrate binding protein [Ideonella livida]|uniref:Tripartite tricarboxylate transporter substrate binding protein n=1 Tax=Ideonella livida TaxID=2707176 RepID=A0A7C9PI82_9BURK|nr:tripartite tricarboxylate transporter substrate binding protein [Ideonella livida]NDY92469.1 tripartite tricarboxylate transporter substrate binding protein [Ideonella livida]